MSASPPVPPSSTLIPAPRAGRGVASTTSLQAEIFAANPAALLVSMLFFFAAIIPLKDG